MRSRRRKVRPGASSQLGVRSGCSSQLSEYAERARLPRLFKTLSEAVLVAQPAPDSVPNFLCAQLSKLAARSPSKEHPALRHHPNDPFSANERRPATTGARHRVGNRPLGGQVSASGPRRNLGGAFDAKVSSLPPENCRPSTVPARKTSALGNVEPAASASRAAEPISEPELDSEPEPEPEPEPKPEPEPEPPAMELLRSVEPVQHALRLSREQARTEAQMRAQLEEQLLAERKRVQQLEVDLQVQQAKFEAGEAVRDESDRAAARARRVADKAVRERHEQQARAAERKICVAEARERERALQAQIDSMRAAHAVLQESRAAAHRRTTMFEAKTAKAREGAVKSVQLQSRVEELEGQLTAQLEHRRVTELHGRTQQADFEDTLQKLTETSEALTKVRDTQNIKLQKLAEDVRTSTKRAEDAEEASRRERATAAEAVEARAVAIRSSTEFGMEAAKSEERAAEAERLLERFKLASADRDHAHGLSEKKLRDAERERSQELEKTAEALQTAQSEAELVQNRYDSVIAEHTRKEEEIRHKQAELERHMRELDNPIEVQKRKKADAERDAAAHKRQAERCVVLDRQRAACSEVSDIADELSKLCDKRRKLAQLRDEEAALREEAVSQDAAASGDEVHEEVLGTGCLVRVDVWNNGSFKEGRISGCRPVDDKGSDGSAVAVGGGGNARTGDKGPFVYDIVFADGTCLRRRPRSQIINLDVAQAEREGDARVARIQTRLENVLAKVRRSEAAARASAQDEDATVISVRTAAEAAVASAASVVEQAVAAAEVARLAEAAAIEQARGLEARVLELERERAERAREAVAEAAAVAQAAADAAARACAQAEAALGDAEASNSLCVIVECADGLRPMEGGKRGTSNPMCTLALADQKYETTVCVSTLEPRWDHDLKFELSEALAAQAVRRETQTVHESDSGSDEMQCPLVLEMYNNDATSDPTKNFMGKVELTLNEIGNMVSGGSSCSSWFELVNTQGKQEKKGRGRVKLSLALNIARRLQPQVSDD